MKHMFKNAYCLICGHKAEEKDLDCKACGCKSLILGEDGEDYKRTEDKIICICGSEEFALYTHLSFDEFHKNVDRCLKCDKTITIDTKVGD